MKTTDASGRSRGIADRHADLHDLGKSGRIPFIMSAEERDFVRSAADAACPAEYMDGATSAAREIVDAAVERGLRASADLPGTSSKFARPAVRAAMAEICLCSGTGSYLIETLVEAAWSRPEMSEAAESLVVRILGVMSEEPEPSTLGPAEADEGPADQDQTPEWIVENIYRIGLGLPVRLRDLGQRQYDRMSEEARVFADAFGCEMEDYERDGNRGIAFIDRGTGGRPGRIGAIELANPDTFSAGLIFTAGPAREPWWMGTSFFGVRDIRRNLMTMALKYKETAFDEAGRRVPGRGAAKTK